VRAAAEKRSPARRCPRRVHSGYARPTKADTIKPMPVTPGFLMTPGFQTTHWSVVLLARDAEASQALSALEQLCLAYWKPLYALARCSGLAAPDAEDAVQGFFAQLIARQGLRHVHQAKGRFRSFMLASLRNFMADERDRARAAKRGGGTEVLSLDFAVAEKAFESHFAKGESPERVFDRAWAMAVLERAQDGLRKECEAAGKRALHDALGPESEEQSHATIATRLGLTESAVKAAAFRIRRRYRELIREEIAQTVSSEADLRGEVDDLMRAVGGG
jgi:DNA-directed RNA polymerase specialized sigma24 family protein